MKNFGVKPYLFPMPTYMIGTYNEDDSVDVMMMAWGGICAEDMVALNLESEHKTVVNLEARRAFTLAVPGVETLEQSDFLGIATANKTADKFARSGLHAVKSERVDAPVITEYPLTLECEVVEMQNQPYGLRVLGRIVNVIADEKVLDAAGKIDAGKIQAFREKDDDDGSLINGGFMVLNPGVFDYIEGDDTVFEQEPLRNLARDGELMAFRHEGFWKCMDTQREKQQLEALWQSGKAPWKIWKG